MEKIYSGFIINPKPNGQIDYKPNGALVVGNGKILFCGAYVEALNKFSGAEIMNTPNSIIIPGLIDLHTHLPQ
jgi:cytosine/adenosine deaminase-related metal-dependent hydrolase